jgi:hypothetical protein
MNWVIEMMRSIATSPERSRFDDFLSASIGEEGNGMALSVVSALARLDLDPWREAASLAAMPKKAAAERMAWLISTLPDRTIALPDPEALAMRLVALLPRPRDAERPRSAPVRRAPGKADPRIIVFVILMAFLLSTQFLMRSRQSAAPADNGGAPAFNAVSSPGPAR